MTISSQHSDWISVADLEKGFETDSFALDHTADLSGRTLTLNGAQHTSRTLRLSDDGQVQLGDGTPTAYRATSVRDGIYLLDWLDSTPGAKRSFTLVLDTLSESYTLAIGQLPALTGIDRGLYKRALENAPLTDVTIEVEHGTLGRSYAEAACAHGPTDELIGIRNLYRYSPTEVYEHIYLNGSFYTWHCLKGVERGLCDTDACHYFKIADQLYLFVWREKIVPTLGLVMVDMQNHRSDGKLFGVGGSEDAPLANFPVASYCQCLNVTEYTNDL